MLAHWWLISGPRWGSGHLPWPSIRNLPDVAHLAIDILYVLLLVHLEASQRRRVPKKMESIPKKI